MAERFSSPLDGKCVARLKNNIEGHVHFDPYTVGRYSTDASIYQVAPFGVVIPKTIQDLVAAVEIAADYIFLFYLGAEERANVARQLIRPLS